MTSVRSVPINVLKKREGVKVMFLANIYISPDARELTSQEKN